jgi:glycosyltransferase involved in cell wall biosynthesis
LNKAFWKGVCVRVQSTGEAVSESGRGPGAPRVDSEATRATDTNASSQPLVSICISAYNVERFLKETLDSILNQTYLNTEIILVDNGSIDRTFDVAQSFQDDHFRCFRIPENIGGYQAMNKVAAMARGDLVAIYHSDDVYEPAIVEKEVAYLQSHPEAGAVFTMYQYMDEEGGIYGGFDLPGELADREYLRYEDIFPYMLRHGNIMFACPTFMARREVLAEVGPFDPEHWDIAADQEMWLRLLRRYPVGILNERLLRYRHTTEQWSQRWRRLRTEPDRALDIMELFLEKDNWRARLSPEDLVELRYQRCDDVTTRAANAVICGDANLARRLMECSYPYSALLSNFHRRKLRVLLMRGLLKSALALRADRQLGWLLCGTEYGDWRRKRL